VFGEAEGGRPAEGPGVPIPAQLPPDVHGFTGRAAELEALDGLLAGADCEPHALVISAASGTAGVGKTALAVHWARRVADRFPDGQLFLDLRGYGPDDPLPAATALEVLLLDLGVGAAQLPQRLDQRMARYRSLVADRRMLVLLDNARSADQVRPLLPGSGTCLVVVTSRDSLSAWSPATALAVWTLTFCPSPTRCCCCAPSSASGWMPNYRRGATGRPPDLVPGPAGGTAGRRAPAAGRAHRG